MHIFQWFRSSYVSHFHWLRYLLFTIIQWLSLLMNISKACPIWTLISPSINWACMCIIESPGCTPETNIPLTWAILQYKTKIKKKNTLIYFSTPWTHTHTHTNGHGGRGSFVLKWKTMHYPGDLSPGSYSTILYVIYNWQQHNTFLVYRDANSVQLRRRSIAFFILLWKTCFASICTLTSMVLIYKCVCILDSLLDRL